MINHWYAGGFVFILAGIVIGNVCLSRMVDFVTKNSPAGDKLFSPGGKEVKGTRARQAIAFRRYREMIPGGDLYKMLRLGQALVGVGLFVWFIETFCQIKGA